MHFLVMACIFFWMIAAALVPFGFIPPFDEIGSVLFVLALILSAYSAIRSFRPRYTRYYVNIPNLPAEWRGRKAVFFSDVHLGNIRGVKSARKAVEMTNAENPDIVFIPGDLFDGPPADYAALVAPLADLKAPHGVYFTEGNHEEFRDPAPYLEAIRGAGVKILNKEMVVIDGMQILGLAYDDSNEPEEVRASLAAIPFDPEKPSILLKHAPSVVQAVAVAGVSLMLSGHTHNAQMWPYKFFVRRLFGKASYGHSKMGNLQTITSSGFGTWGPPQRFGTKAEVVVIKFS
jgi:predicted MPP superfamily phosphohydrolase